MTPPSTEVSRGPRRRARSAPWPLLLGTFLIVVHSAAFGSANGVADGRLADTDAFTWAVRATELRTTGEWFDDTLDNVYPPVGLKQHWSRPFDVLLVAGGLLGEPIVGFSRALFGWAVALPAVLGVVAFWTLWWGYRDVLDAAGADGFALLFSLQPVILAGFMAGRADHQAFIGVLIVATLGVARRAFNAPASTSLLTALGILSAFGLWVGMELVIVIVVLYVTLAIDWVLMRDDAAALAVRYSSVVPTTSLAA